MTANNGNAKNGYFAGFGKYNIRLDAVFSACEGAFLAGFYF